VLNVSVRGITCGIVLDVSVCGIVSEVSVCGIVLHEVSC